LLAEEKSSSAQLRTQITALEGQLADSRSNTASSHSSEIQRLQSQHQSAIEALRNQLDGQLVALQAKLKQADATHRQLEDQLLTRERSSTSSTTTVISKPVSNDAELNAMRQKLQQDMSKLQLELKQSSSSELSLPADTSSEQWRLRYEQLAAEKQTLHRAHQQSLFHFDQQVKQLQTRLHSELTNALQRQSELHSQDLKNMQKRMVAMSEHHASETQKMVAQPRMITSSSQQRSVQSMSSQEASAMIGALGCDHALAHSKLDLAKQQLTKAMAALQAQQQKTKQLKGSALSLAQSNRSAQQAVTHLLGRDGGMSGGAGYSSSSSTVVTKTSQKTVSASA
jgi:hypothetical protein